MVTGPEPVKGEEAFKFLLQTHTIPCHPTVLFRKSTRMQVAPYPVIVLFISLLIIRVLKHPPLKYPKPPTSISM
jgi:hypothetical protein